MRYRTGKQWFGSLLLLIAGIGLLLVNIGVISLEIKEVFVVLLPAIIALYGLKKLLDALLQKSSGSLLVGLFALCYGGLILCSHWDLIDFGWEDWWKLWPILIVSIAFNGIFQKKKVKISFETDYPFVKDKDESSFGKKKNMSMIGDMKFQKANWPLEPMDMFNAVGDYYFDFGKAYIPEKTTPLNVKGWVGDVKMIIPEDLPVKIYTKVKIGDIRLFEQTSDGMKAELFYESPDYEEAVKRLQLTVELGVGSIRIVRV
ncbi:cell wall-active antibiotics response protein LiaF [Falsibacillus albus]|uniref:Uncharacterized protein n=1 Tax=Falsibacillus albus TaxID=2478915 RepID=A0A3L7K3S3_9BACI|nr:cell wall-active antibiotics response protein LiaF [Falsibacillus albus]RLQ97285.1 hypothetical protein D9X91_03810 [Falsibacillus albus]